MKKTRVRLKQQEVIFLGLMNDREYNSRNNKYRLDNEQVVKLFNYRNKEKK